MSESDRIKALVELLSSPEPRIRFNAAEELGRMGTDGAPAVMALVQLLDDPVPTVRAEIVEALGNIGPPAEKSIRPLLALAEVEPSIRQTVRHTLTQIVGIAAGEDFSSAHARTVSLSPEVSEKVRELLQSEPSESEEES